MVKRGNRLTLSSTLAPDAYDIMIEATQDLDLTQSRTLDLIIREWHEMSMTSALEKTETSRKLDGVKEQLVSLQRIVRNIEKTASRLEHSDRVVRLSS